MAALLILGLLHWLGGLAGDRLEGQAWRDFVPGLNSTGKVDHGDYERD
ncbi:hypothetical protein [uncultured Maritimibacter sp.]|nr:hypothetical protein [uncultured Maritimibacter sp.]